MSDWDAIGTYVRDFPYFLQLRSTYTEFTIDVDTKGTYIKKIYTRDLRFDDIFTRASTCSGDSYRKTTSMGDVSARNACIGNIGTMKYLKIGL